jgi:GT2 family glycosyltransferase
VYRTAIIVPTYRRPDDLARCIGAVAAQRDLPTELIVVTRRGDQPTSELLAKSSGSISSLKNQGILRIIEVDVPGVIAAMQAGLDAASPDIEVIALTDDDAAPRPEWLGQISDRLKADEKLGGVGGRDWQWYDGRVNNDGHPIVGKVQWFGRIIGNHHVGIGGPRDVDILKGANCAFRASLLREIGFDQRLRGAGAQVHWEMSLCLQIRRRGWRRLYDPAVAVDHYPSQRADADMNNRGGFHAPSLQDSVHNETLILLDNLPLLRKAIFLTWAALIGTRSSPGLAQTLLALFRRRPNVAARLRAHAIGRLEGWRSYRLETADRNAHEADRKSFDASTISRIKTTK